MFRYNNNDKRGRGLAISAVVLSSSLVSMAVAQELEEVVVSAERRETSLQNTPISIVALSAESMEAKGVEDVADIALFTPNLTINGSRGTGNNTPIFAIRGISGGGGTTSERGVALYIDDIYVPRTNGSVFRVFDLERVEVLRGPQGTLFGRNSEGGAIRLVTKQPTQDFEAYVKANLGNFSHNDFIGMVNLPVNDTVAMRLQVARLDEDGYVRRGPELLGGQTDWLGRLQVAFTPSESVKVTLGGLWSDSQSTGSPNIFKRWDMTPGINGPGVAAADAIQGNYADWVSDWLANSGQSRLATVDDPRLVRGDFEAPDFCFLDDGNPDWDNACAQKNDNRYWQLDGKLRWDVSETSTLTLTSGHAEMRHTGITDWQYLGTENRPDDVKSVVNNNEALLNTALFGGRVDLVSGLNFFQEHSSSDVRTYTVRGTSVFNATTGGVANTNAWAGLYTIGSLATDQTSHSAGLFSSATWHVIDSLNVTGGLRVSRETKSIQYLRRGGSGPAPTFAGMSAANDFVPSYAGNNGATSIAVAGKHAWTVLDWRGTIDYHFTPDVMIYGTASKAFKAGQYAYTVVANLSPSAQSSIIRPIDPEKVENLELGMRTTWVGGRLRVNPTGFWMAWTNRQSAQQQACPNDPSCPAGFRIITVNAGDVDVYGLELDAQLAVTDRLTFDGSLGTTHYRLKDPVANLGPYLFPDQPTPSYNLGLTYSTAEMSVGQFAFNLNYAYRGSMQTYPGSLTFPANTVDSSYELPSFGLWNARLQLTTPGARNVVALYANNLTDKTYATYATRFGGGFWDAGGPNPVGRAAPPRSALQWVMGRPREFGITLQHNF